MGPVGGILAKISRDHHFTFQKLSEDTTTKNLMDYKVLFHKDCVEFFTIQVRIYHVFKYVRIQKSVRFFNLSGEVRC